MAITFFEGILGIRGGGRVYRQNRFDQFDMSRCGLGLAGVRMSPDNATAKKHGWSLESTMGLVDTYFIYKLDDSLIKPSQWA